MYKFKMNNQEFVIKEVTQKEMLDYYCEEDKGYYYGQTHFQTHEIWLSKEQPKWQKEETLYHELLHCYIRCYITTQEIEYNEESVCDISSKAHNIINQIANDYLKVK